MPIPVSVLILTYNEEINIEACLDSLSDCEDIWVLDSESTDGTIGIAEAKGAKVRLRPFDNYAAQRNYGLALPFLHDWILMLDADERMSPELLDEIREVIAKKDDAITLYRLRRKDMFMGRWIKHSSGYPTWFGRLIRKGRVTVEREINEEYITDGAIGLLDSHLVHYPFNKGLTYWFARHNRYSSMEAIKLAEEIKSEGVPWKYFFHQDPMLRRRAFKRMAYRVPCRPLITFLYLYFMRGGFLDGRAGFRFSMLRATYEFMIDMKMAENSCRDDGF